LTAPIARMPPRAVQGLRELKKVRTRRLIADVAARLFAERGYERVAVSDVARDAEVSEQTVYNYVQTKEQLVIDRDRQVQDHVVGLIRVRAPGVSAAAALRDFVLASVDGIPSISPELWRGELGYLAVISPTVHVVAGDDRPLSRRHRQPNQRHPARPGSGGQAPETPGLGPQCPVVHRPARFRCRRLRTQQSGTAVSAPVITVVQSLFKRAHVSCP